ncbi:MAG: protein kinase [Planctomycetota bacterium]
MATNCSNCGAALDAGARFCPSCGTRVAGGSEEGGLIGTVFNQKYRLEAQIGEGSMGTVFLGEHLGLKKRVALKVLHRDLTLGEEVLQRFQREGIAAGKFTHPYAIQIFDFDRSEEGFSYLAMEYVEGQNLREYLSEHGATAVQLAVDLTLQVLAVLAEAHSHGIVHRDLKPENIMVLKSAGGALNVKVLDFGLSKLVDRPQGASLMTQPGRILGTPLYMAPEQAGGEDVDHRSDLYAAGLILYELLAGKGPFQGDTFTELLVQQATAAPPSLGETRPELGVSAELEAVIDRALEKDREQRYQSATEMSDALGAASLTGAPRQRGPGAASDTGDGRSRWRTFALAAVISFVASVGAVVAGRFLDDGGDSTPSAEAVRVRLKPAAERFDEEERYVRLLDEARSSLRAGASDVALSALLDAADLSCRDAELFVVRALAYRQRGDDDTAVLDLEAALEADPGYAEAAAMLGWLELDRGRRAEAEAAFARGLEADATYPAALAGRAALLREAGDAAGAEELLDQAIERDRSCAPAQYQLGLVRLERGDTVGAATALVEAKRHDPRNPRIFAALGDAYRADGRDADAEAQYRSAVDLERSAPGALIGLATLYAEQERFADLIDVLEVPLGEAADRPELGLLLASALQMRGDGGRARAALERLAGGEPDARALTLLGLLRALEGDALDAVESFDRALELDEELASAHRGLGLTLFRIERYEEAAATLERAVELRPDDAYAQLMLGVLYMEYVTGRDKARSYFEAYRRLGGDDPRLDGWMERVR